METAKRPADEAHTRAGSDTVSDPAPVRKGRLRRIAEEEYILVVLLAGFGLIFLLVFPPALLVNDSWLNLMAGREVVENGLPSHDELTVYGLGATWTDQQWLAQVFMYGVYSLGGFALLSIATCASVVGAFALAAAAARSLGAGARAFWVMFLPVLVAAPWAWSIRAQMLDAAALHGAPLASRERGARRPRRVWLAFPMLVRLGEHPRERGARRAARRPARRVRARSQPRPQRGARSIALSSLAPLAVLATPYGPADDRPLLPPHARRPALRGAGDRVELGRPCREHVRSSTCWPRSPSRSCWLGTSTADRLRHRRSRVSPSRAASRDPRDPVVRARVHGVRSRRDRARSLESKRRGEPRRGLNVVDRCRAHRRARRRRAARSSPGATTWFEDYWPSETVDAVRAELRPGDRVFVPDRFSDWMLFKIPELRGRDRVRRALRDLRQGVLRPARRTTTASRAATGSRSRTATGSSIVDETNRRTPKDFLEEPGARVIYRDDEITVIARPSNLTSTGAPEDVHAVALEHLTQRGSLSRRRHERADDLGVTGQDRRVRHARSRVAEIDDDPVRASEHAERSRRTRRADRCPPAAFETVDGRIAGHERDRRSRPRRSSSGDDARAAERHRADGSRPWRDDERERRRAHEDRCGGEPAPWRTEPRDPETPSLRTRNGTIAATLW